MTPEQHQRIGQLFHAALELEPAARTAFLDQVCAGDEALRREVESLLASHECVKEFIAAPALEVAAKALAQVATPVLVGQRLGHYQMLALLGAGGMGEVYLAQDTRLRRKVALKLLPAEFTANPDRLRRFAQEARAASALNHPNIITIHEIGEVAGIHYIATEFIDGQTLRQQMTDNRIKLSAALEIAAQVASALTEAHAAGIVHRDIKPENIMLRRDGYVKVLDFGLAKLTERPASETVTDLPTGYPNETASGTVLGTARYMSPEQARGQKVDGRSDIFSLGVVLYELVTGKRPFEGATLADVLVALLQTEPAPLLHAAGVPKALEWIVTKALRKDREERYQTAKELLTDLRNLKQRLELQAELARERDSAASGGVGVTASSALAGVETAQELAANTGKIETAQHTSSAEYLVSELKRHKRGAVVALAVLVVGVVALAYLVSRHLPGSPVNQPARRTLLRLTYDPGLQSEPTWSPDGRFVAYSADRGGNFDIWVQPVSGGNPIQVTNSPAHDWQPDWSRDGNNLVFRSERDGGGLFVAPAPTGGNERKVSAFGYRPRWSPDGSQILFYSALLRNITETFKVYVVGLDGKPPRELLPDLLSEFASLRVAWHPDGQRISLWGRRYKQDWSFWTSPLAGGPPLKSDIAPQVEQQLKESGVIFSNFLWSPTGRTLYFEGLSQSVNNLWKVEVDPQSLRWIGGLERLTTDPGPDTDIALSQDGRKLAYTIRTEQTRLWSFPFAAATGRLKAAGQTVTAAGVDAWQPDLSPDGKKLVFIAARAGEQELRVKALADNRETLLIAAGSSALQSPRWSPDGARIAYRRYYPLNPERTRIEGSIVWVSAEGGEEHALTTRGQAEELVYDWSADGVWLLGSSNRLTPGRVAMSLFPLSAAPRAETQMRVLTANPEYNLRQARLSPNQRWICFNAVKATDAGASTIYVVPAAGGTWQRITEENYRAAKGRWSPDGKTIYFVSNRAGFFNVWGIRFDLMRGQPSGQAFRVTEFESPGRMVSPLAGSNDFALTADRFVVPLTEVSGSLWILENLRSDR